MTLLRHTHGGEVKQRSALTVNPAKTCQPVGAMYAALGIHRCLPHSHGSQGCCSYHRSTLTRHFKEPVMAATSSFTEGSSVFGGQANLLQGINNVFTLYEPDVVAVHTTCLSETIGDDIPQIVEKARDDGLIPDGKYVIHANTPSYVGSHVVGFSNMTKAMVKYFAEKRGATATNRVNIVPGWVEPADVREIKQLVSLMGLDSIVFPDTSGVLDCPQSGVYQMYPKGGVTIDELKAVGDSAATITLGQACSDAAGEELKNKCGVPHSSLPMPLGLDATDRFIMELRKLNGGIVPQEISDQRGRLIDLISDMHQYFYGKTAAIWGDPDTLVGLADLLISVDILPRFVVTGTPGKAFLKRVSEVLGPDTQRCEVRQGAQADMYLMHQWIKNERVDLLVGNTYGKYIARDEDIPLVRHGFPILDRVGHQFFPTVGYRGAIRVLEQILNVFMDRQDRDAPEESFELTM